MNQHEQIGVEDIVDQCDHFVADTLDAVLSLPTIIEGAALAGSSATILLSDQSDLT